MTHQLTSRRLPREGGVWGVTIAHAVLLAYTALAVAPILLITINAFKTRLGIFGAPLSLPTMSTFSLEGFRRVLIEGDAALYFANSLVVTVVSVALVLFTGLMAAWALTEYRFILRQPLRLYLALGIMLPIRLGTVSILQTMVTLDLVNTLTALILVYVAQGLPIAILILSVFIAQIPRELRDAARCDGVGEFKIFARIILPLCRPALASVAIFTMVPVWNDLWFPLILAPAQDKQTITLGIQQFVGQYVTDWNAVISALLCAMLPALLLYLFFSRQLIRGLTAGAVK